MSVTALPSHVQELADRVAAGHGVEVLELALRGQGRGRVLSVVLDAEEPVEADVVELVSKDLSRALDEADPVSGRYTLEVSTPGLSRPLHTRRDFRRQRGHEVSVVRAPEPEAEAEVEGSAIQGVVVDADDEAVVLEVDGSQVRVPLSEVVRGKVVLPW
ncbi:MAG TPA: ribosome maturation factor RimP [Actinomycetota bacterium]|nr:ribosome maturation factor RimP [Actinomycetota bacterium]